MSGARILVADDEPSIRWLLERILQQAGYKGPLNFEYNSAESDERVGIRKGIEYTRQMLSQL